MMILLSMKLLLCIAIVLRVLLYRRGDSTHRPIAAGIAYLLVIAVGWMAIDAGYALAGRGGQTDAAELFLLAILLAALIAGRGNVVALFWTGDAGRLYRLITRSRHHAD